MTIILLFYLFFLAFAGSIRLRFEHYGCIQTNHDPCLAMLQYF